MEASVVDDLGPIDIVVIAYPADAPMTGDAVPEFMKLVESGTIRVLDAMFVVKNADGTFSGFEARDLTDKGVGGFEVFDGAASGLLGESDAKEAADALEPGTAAVMIMYENHWAAPFAAAVRRNGGQVIANERIPLADIAEMLEGAEAAV